MVDAHPAVDVLVLTAKATAGTTISGCRGRVGYPVTYTTPKGALAGDPVVRPR